MDTVDWLLVFSSESNSVLCDEGKEVGLNMLDSLVEGDAGSGGICLSSCSVACGVPFIATRCVSNSQYMVLQANLVLKWGQNWYWKALERD